MEKYPMNRPGGRSMYGNCPCPGEMMNMPPMRKSMPARSCQRESIFDHADHLPLAMAYVPYQTFTTTFDTCYALKAGTIFPDLCKPFCGKGGLCR